MDSAKALRKGAARLRCCLDYQQVTFNPAPTTLVYNSGYQAAPNALPSIVGMYRPQNLGVQSRRDRGNSYKLVGFLVTKLVFFSVITRWQTMH
jgi:hypothetical protein